MPMDKTFDAAKAEPRISAAWEDAGAFRAGANASRDDSFTIMIPPPNVTGALHVGHAFNNTLQDILVRWHRMRGFDTLWQPGQDHAGIATQLQVEKKLKAEEGKRRTDLARDEFLARVWEWKGEYGGTIINQLKRIGSSCDWSRNAFTMAGAPGDPRTGHENSPNFHDAVIKVFVDMYDKGLIYRGKRLVNWDPHFETAISDLEVENIETPGQMWHFKYPLAGGATYEYVEKDEDGTVTLRETRDYISIATTRPETMLGDGAVAVNPADERYAPLVGQLCEIPVGPREHRRLIPIITDPYPDPDFGSGAVKITGAHDFNDYEVAKRGGIPMYRLMDTKGHMRDDGAPYEEAAAIAMAVANGERDLSEAEADALNLVPDHLRGLDRFEARAKVVEEITAEGLAVMTSPDDPRLGKPRVAPAPEPGPRGTEEVPDQVRDDTSAKDSVAPAPEPGPRRTDAQARQEVLDHVQDAMVPLVEAKPIMQPFGDRSKVVIEPMLTDQWFVDAAKIVGPALDAVRDGRVRIMPESGEKTYFHWLENIEPWCISRQLWWGHQIPVWYDNLGNRFCAPTAWEAAKKAIRFHQERLPEAKFMFTVVSDPKKIPDLDKERLDDLGFYQFDDRTIIDFDPSDDETFRDEEGRERANPWGSQGAAEEFYGSMLYQDPDVLDTWFSSGLWPIGTLGWPEQTDELKRYFPTDVLITGQDILFFWVARMMMMQLAVVDDIPFHTVYLHQLVRDEKGKKMSKTAGNVIDPLEIVDEYGADALRFANASMASIGGVLKLSVDKIKGYRNFGTKLWNACRFAEMNGVFDAPRLCTSGARAVHARCVVNRWIMGETARVREEVDAALAEYRFNDAANALYSFVWGVVCDWYVEFSKPLILDGTDEEKAETQQVMGWVLDQCLILLHPFMPFITEELWSLSHADRPAMLAVTDWPGYSAADLVDPEAEREMRWAIALIEGVRSVRAQMNVPVGLYVPLLKLDADAHATASWSSNETLIKRLARIDSLADAPNGTAPKGSLTVATPGATFALPLADIIDVEAEKARLSKALAKVEKEAGGLRGRLGNPKFLASAPEDVVAEARENLALRDAEIAQLSTALERLNEI